jgi:hypothetical protein
LERKDEINAGFTLEEGETAEEADGDSNLDYKIENVVATLIVDIKEKIDRTRFAAWLGRGLYLFWGRITFFVRGTHDR